ncbi:MAG TPA: TAXI family TRAP transporter solute-binding subunit [Thermodesulfobacteriota bacterium]|nr:TAXI family TRAP transporter solute-binding subunit [Thermodesulfobacteriota bacterium]
MRRALPSTLLAAWLLAAAPVAAQPIGIGTSPQGTLTYSLGATFAKVLTETAGLQARVQPSSGTGVMVPLVDSGELDVGFVNTLEVTEAYTGTGSFNGRPQRNIRMIGVLFPIKVGLFVRKDSPIRTVKDIRGKAIAYGYTSQEIIKTLVDGILANAGLTAADVRTVLVPNLIRGVDEFIAGRVDVGFFALGQAKVAEADAAVGGIRFIPLVDEPAAVAAMQRVVPPSYLATAHPAPGLPGVLEPIKTMAYDYVVFTNARVPKERVYQLTKVLVEQKGALAASMAQFKELEPERMYRESRVPYHEGAIAYYREKGIALSR